MVDAEAGAASERDKPWTRADEVRGIRHAMVRDHHKNLPEFRPGAKTQGVWVDESGSPEPLISGNDEQTVAADRLIEESRMLRPGRRLVVTSHVEVKFAMMMRERGLSDETIAINRLPCDGP